MTRRDAVTTLGEGMTPMLDLPRLGAHLRVPLMRLKDESPLPTGSFKARGAAVGVSRLVELGVEAFAMPTNGNAGAAWSAYAARAGIAACIVMARGAPSITRSACTAAGAEVVSVDGLIDEAGRVAADLCSQRGWFNAATLREPYRLEGKKTIGLEILEQSGWRMPDVVVCPTGGGVALVGIAKGIDEARRLEWVDGEAPRLVAVQSAACAPVVEAWRQGAPRCRPWHGDTVAFGINVPCPLGDELILRSLRDTRGTAVAVDDDEILEALRLAAALEGVFLCPEAAAAVAATARLRRDGWLDEGETVVVLGTGAGQTYPEALAAAAGRRGPGA